MDTYGRIEKKIMNKVFIVITHFSAQYYGHIWELIQWYHAGFSLKAGSYSAGQQINLFMKRSI